MATHRIPLGIVGSMPDTSGKAWVEPYSILATSDVMNKLVARVDESSANTTALTVKAGFYGGFTVPKNYVGTASIVIVWSSTKTSGDVVFDFDYRAVGGDDSESFDQATWQESVTAADTAASATDERLEMSMNLTSANLAADDNVTFFVGCDGTDTTTGGSGDTLAGLHNWTHASMNGRSLRL